MQDLVARHLGGDLVLYSTQLAYKPPNAGRAVPWHQDGERCRTVWIPLDNVDPENGGLIVQPGAHVHGRLPYKRVSEVDLDDALFNTKYSVFAVIPPGQPGQPLGYRLRAGALEIHDPLLPHCSLPNTTDTPRRVVILRYQPVSEPLAQNPIINPRTGRKHAKCNYLVRGRYGNAQASRDRAKARLDR